MNIPEQFQQSFPQEVLPALQKEGISFHECSDGFRMVFVPSVDAAEFDSYCATLTEAGFEPVATNTLGDVDARTFLRKSDGVTVHAYRTDHASELRIIAGTTALLPPEAPAEVPAVCKPMIIQLDASCGLPALNEGMGYLVRLQDGSFFVVDGGYPRGVSAKRIYDAMKRYAPDPDHIRVACWFFTHGHGDHIGAFQQFAEMYHDEPDVTIESFLANLCEDPDFCRNIVLGSVARLKDYFGRFFPDAKVYVPFTGQKFPLPGAELTIFFTTQDYMPREIPNEPDATPKAPKTGDGNHLCTVSRLSVGDRSFFIMGDTTTVCCDEMCLRYGGELKSDYLQIAHHGLAPTDPTVYQPRRHNGTKAIYALIRPTVVFLPCGIERAPDRMSYDVNAYAASLAKQVYISGEGEAAVELP